MTEADWPWYDIDEIYPLLGYKNRRAAVRAIRVGRFPVPTYRICGRRPVVDRVVLREYFRRNREEGLEPFNMELVDD